jgi:hypothetical protein
MLFETAAGGKTTEGTHIMTTPDESAAPQPSSNDSPWAQYLAKLSAYFVSNVAATVAIVWSVVLFVGGMIFLVYFASIGFMPELDVKASITLLATSAFTGIWLLALLSLYLIGLGWSWRLTTNNNERLQVLWYEGGQFVPWRAMLWGALPLVGIEAGILILLSLFAWWGISIWWVNAPPALILFIPSLVVFLFWKKLPGNPPCILRWPVARDLFRGFFSSFVAVLSLLIILYVFIRQTPDLSNTLVAIFF